ncbi:MAG: hypothetical protein KDD03_01610 [Gelidibacter sp.]|nr:hypothetical protein [Gelidibacter sp.]
MKLYNQNFTLKTLFVLFILVTVTSCVKDVDFDQTENIVPSPILESNLIYSTLVAPNFIDDSTQQEVITLTDTTRVEVISSDFFVDQLSKANLTFRFINSIDRQFVVDFEFLNDNDELKYNIQMPVPSGTVNSPILSETTVTIEEPELTSFKEATKLVYKITLPPTTTPLTSNTAGQLELQSKATLYFEL